MSDSLKKGLEKEKKKVGIVTLYRAYNHGAFLQAYSLQKYLNEKGHDTFFLNIYNYKHILLTLKSLKPQKKHPFKSTIFNFKKYLIFKKSQKIFKVTPAKTKLPSIIVGSDEVWNINNSSFIPRKEFFGLGLNTKNLIAFAPSAAKSTSNDLSHHSTLTAGIEKFNFISGRDQHALDIIENYSKKPSLRAIDPTFLTKIEERNIDVGFEKFIAIYSYGFDKKNQTKIIEFAQKKGLPIVSIGFYAGWCDKSINADPFQFISTLKKAEFIITDTFHGTVLSAKLNKNFAVFSSGKEKIEDFLYYYELEHKKILPQRDLESVLRQSSNVRSSCSKILIQTQKSREFLETALTQGQ